MVQQLQAVQFFVQVSIMQQLAKCRWTAKLLDFGLAGTDWWLVMPLYATSLKQWRSRHPPGIGSRLPLYISIFVQLCHAVMVRSLTMSISEGMC